MNYKWLTCHWLHDLCRCKRNFTSTQSSLCFFFLMFVHPVSLLCIGKNGGERWGYSLVCDSSSSSFFLPLLFSIVVAGCVNAILLQLYVSSLFNKLKQIFVSVTLIKICNNTLLVLGVCVELYLCTWNPENLLVFIFRVWSLIAQEKIPCGLLQASLLDTKFSLIRVWLTMKCLVCCCLLS